VEKCVNSQTMRPYPAAMIEKSLRDLHFNADATRSAKVQALEAIVMLQTLLPIRRALMRLRVQVCSALHRLS
jgi:ribosome maturation protein Sdo1